MIAELQGKVSFKTEKFIILDVNGVGYKIFCSEKTLKELPAAGETAKFFTRLILREGETIELYGFLNYDELDLFEKLLGVSGIGPKAALNLASLGSLGELKDALSSGKKVVSGIGPKKVQKILLELGEEIKKIQNTKYKIQDTNKEAIEALAGLGVPRSRARELVSEISEEVEGTENIVKEALKKLGG